MVAVLEVKRQQDAQVVSADTYTEDYYLTDAEGKEEYIETEGRILSPRLARTWELADVRPGMNVLDVGYGRGEILYHCALKGAYVTGVDYSISARQLAENILSGLPEFIRQNVTLIPTDINEMPFPDNHFDRIFMLDIVEHLSPFQLDNLLQDVRRVLKIGGKCIIHTMPNRLFWDVGYQMYMKWVDALIKLLIKGRPIIRHEGRNHYSLKVHINEQTIWSMRKLLKNHGLNGKTWLEDDFFHAKNRKRCTWTELIYEAIMRLWPISNIWPLYYIFHHTIYATVTKER